MKKVIPIILYIISPIDLVPEALLGPFGLADDVGALIYLIKTLVNK